jgi:hypothetical protein
MNRRRGREEGDVAGAISDFERVLDQIQANSVQKAGDESEQYEQASQLNQDINGLKARMFQEDIPDRD